MTTMARARLVLWTMVLGCGDPSGAESLRDALEEELQLELFECRCAGEPEACDAQETEARAELACELEGHRDLAEDDPNRMACWHEAQRELRRCVEALGCEADFETVDRCYADWNPRHCGRFCEGLEGTELTTCEQALETAREEARICSDALDE